MLGQDDSFDLHVKDTLESGDGLCHREVVELVVKTGPERVRELVELGVSFNLGSGADSFDLGREGGHSRNRILHAQDMTGKAVEKVLIAAAEAEPNIAIFENHMVLDLVIEHQSMKAGCVDLYEQDTCRGAYVLDVAGGDIHTFVANVVLLCTGGAGKAYLYTSNPDVATGDGLAIAYRAGAKLANLEFVQFHPTCLYHPAAKNFLISEAVRGEGGRLIDKRGSAFMEKYHPLKDLAFRDIVARAIDTEMKTSGDDCVFLDISHRDSQFLKERFPNIYGRCLSLGLDITKDPIPVVPAAHYMCGGILTNSSGRTTIENLYAIGECACTGLHGANRLASNSLLEAMVFSHAAAVECGERVKVLAKPGSSGGARLFCDDLRRESGKQRNGHDSAQLGFHKASNVELRGHCEDGQKTCPCPHSYSPDKDGTKGAHAQHPFEQRPGGTPGPGPGGRAYHPLRD